MSGQISPYAGKKVLMVGLGLHGGAVSAVRWLDRHGAKLRVTDLKSAVDLKPSLHRLRDLKIDYHLGGHRRADFLWADIIYQNQGVPNSLPELRMARINKTPIINEVTIFFLACPAPIIGVTGTRGKSTTTALIGEMLAQRFPLTVVTGNIRQTPMLALLDRVTPNHKVVAELSSFQLEYLPIIKKSPQVAVMTNLMVDHLNRYPSMRAYAQAKYQIFRWQNPANFAVLNFDSNWTRRVAKITRAQVVWFSNRRRPSGFGVWLKGDTIYEVKSGRLRRLLKIPKKFKISRHHQENFLAAVATAWALKVPVSSIRSGADKFPGLTHRQAFVRRWKSHEFVNDTSATSPDATLAALDVWPNGLFILGGTDKRLKFQALAKQLARGNNPIVLLPGSATQRLLLSLQRVGYRGQKTIASSMSMAVRKAAQLATANQPIVLSPGAASFGLFQHEFDRGDQFIQAVKRLSK